MINHDYLIDSEWCDSGGYCDVMPIKGNPDLLFKSFKYKKMAEEAYNNQLKLSKLDLAPKVISEICQIAYYFDPKILKYWNPNNTVTNHGYITENAIPFACIIKDTSKALEHIQDLVDNIFNLTGLKFWDCHINNIGYIKRYGKNKLVCIDTGNESFNGNSNTWGFSKPGPRCPYCLKYQCECSKY